MSGGKALVALSLIAFDTDHIKSYVFATNRLTEIRGASSLLDELNRVEMRDIAARLPINDTSIKAVPVFTNGGAGLFVVEADEETTREFGNQVKREYRKRSGGAASITFAVQELPPGDEKIDTQSLKDEDRKTLEEFVQKVQVHKKTPVSEAIQATMLRDLHPQIELLRYKLRENKDAPPDTIGLPSHPFMRPCDSCGIEYAEEPQQRAGQAEFYCASCRAKQQENRQIKRNRRIPATIKRIEENMGRPEDKKKPLRESLWNRILSYLLQSEADKVRYPDYVFPPDISNLDLPGDFNVFRQFTKAKEYLGLIYADANNMGTAMDNLHRLLDIYKVAKYIDESIHRAMSRAIKKHLPIPENVLLFPFDILLLGGDDIVMVTDAAKAMDVAVTIAQEFNKLAEEQRDPKLIKNPHTLSIGVVLAPVKYPFGLVWAIAQSALKFAKADGAEAHKRKEDDSRINFLTVTGGSVNDFKKAFDATYHKKDKAEQYADTNEFYATLRPYNAKDLEDLLEAIRDAKKLRLGRTKLHQLREAILEMNLTTAINKGLAVLNNWRPAERTFVAQRVYDFGGRYLPPSNPQDDIPNFPRVTFPWFVEKYNEDGQRVYRTPLLDFIELYDFVVAREGEAGGNGE
jgi:hypothetical protein